MASEYFGSEASSSMIDIRANGSITAKKVIEITRITTQQGASNALSRLIDRDLIKSVRLGRSFIYELP